MANIKSAIKRAKTNEIRRERNIAQKSAMRTSIKKFMTAVEAQNKEEATATLAETTRSLNKAASKGLIHKNAASRKISRLTKKMQTINS